MRLFLSGLVAFLVAFVMHTSVFAEEVATKESVQSTIEKVESTREESADTAKEAVSNAAVATDGKYNFDNMKGNPDAKVELIEYASLSCPHCASFFQEEYPKIKEKYIDTGKVRFVFKDYPLGGLPAFHAAKITHCVPKEKYYDFIEILFKTQDSWATQRNYLEILSNIAKLGDIPTDKFEACIADDELTDRLKENINYARDTYGIGGTPSFVLNGKLVEYRGFEQFSKEIDALLQ